MVFQERMLHGEPTEAKLEEILKHGKEYLPLAMLMTDENSVRWQTMYNYVKSGFPQHQGNSSRNSIVVMESLDFDSEFERVLSLIFPPDNFPDLYYAAVPGGVISEPDLLTTSESEILEGFSDQGVIQVRRITIKTNTTVSPTKHLILTFNSPNLPTSIKAGYLNCKIRPYIPNPLRCFKCQRFDTLKLPVAVNLLALDVHLLDMLPQIAV
ncbi:uncharacterized protein TNCV_1919861 [Trichonephila clavipes]|nr:uncharacterized protein TNCV_1919861 [Trichonephila clavipes]